MYELLPLAAGAVLGLWLLKLGSVRFRPAIVAIVSIVIGVTAAAVSGELEASPLFVLWDGLQCAALAYLLIALKPLRERRRA